MRPRALAPAALFSVVLRCRPSGGVSLEALSEEGHVERARRSVRREVLLLALVFVAYVGMVRYFSSDVPGGSDSWGYVSEAVRLSRGHFYEREHVLSRFGLPEDARLTHPLAYIEKGTEGAVPIYPFGYPLLMAMAIRLLGLQAAFWVTPLLAAGAVLLTYWLGRACLGPAGGVVAALLLGVLPNFLSGAFPPMSDVPAAFFCALTLVALLVMPAGLLPDVALGSALGFAFWVRPNMGILISVVGLWLIARREWRRLLRVALVVAPFLVVEVLLNWYLFGAPWRSGYGDLPLGGPLADILARGARHLLRLNGQQAGVGLLLFAVALIWNRFDPARRLLLAGVFAAFLFFFAAYRIDDAWWYFRFLLPAMPAVAVLEAGFLVHLAGPGLLRRLRMAAVALATCALAFGSLRYAEEKGVFSAKEGEQRYPRVAAVVAGQVEQPALVLAMQHSGSIRFYTDLTTARYDLGTPEKLADTLARVAQGGGNLYLVVDDLEDRRPQSPRKGFSSRRRRSARGRHPWPHFSVPPQTRKARPAFRGRSSGPGGDGGGSRTLMVGWVRTASQWRLDGTGIVRLSPDAEPGAARVCAGAEALPVGRPGFPAASVATGACTDVPLLPGFTGQLAVSPLGGRTATLPPVRVLPVGAIQFQDQLSSAYMVPQIAHVQGMNGSLWKTDLLLVNPQAHPLQVTSRFLPSGRDNRDAPAATTVLAAGAVLTLRDVAKLTEFAWLGDSGALLVYAGEPGKPCAAADCRFLACSRTYNSVTNRESQSAGEWLPGLPPEARSAGGHASSSTSPAAVRTPSVGLASWTVGAYLCASTTAPAADGRESRGVVVPAFGHVRVSLKGQVGRVEVDVIAPPDGARLFSLRIGCGRGEREGLPPVRGAVFQPPGRPEGSATGPSPRPVSELRHDI